MGNRADATLQRIYNFKIDTALGQRKAYHRYI